MISRTILRSTIFSCVLLAAAAAIGQTDAAKKQAQTLQVEGLQLMQKGDDRAALDKFDEAYRLVPSPKILFNRGKAHRALGEDIDALTDFEGFLDQAPYAPKVSRDEATRAVEALRPKLSYIEVQTDDVGSTISLDGRALGTAPLPRPVVVAPGTHEIRVAKPGMTDETRSVSPIAGQKVRVTVKLVAAAAPATPSPGAPPAGAAPPETTAAPPPVAPLASKDEGQSASHPGATRPWQITAAWATAGAGVVFLGGALTAQILSSSKSNAFNAIVDAPNSTKMCNQTLPQNGGGPCQGLSDAAHSRQTLAIVGYVVSGVALAGSLILYFTAPSGSTADRAMAAACLPSEAGGITCALATTF